MCNEMFLQCFGPICFSGLFGRITKIVTLGVKIHAGGGDGEERMSTCSSPYAATSDEAERESSQIDSGGAISRPSRLDKLPVCSSVKGVVAHLSNNGTECMCVPSSV